MPKKAINISLKHSAYFCTFTVRRWYHIFDKPSRFQILADCIKFFQKNKGLVVFGYVFMPNHIHIIFQADNAVEFVRDFKRWTSRRIKEDMEKSSPYTLKLFISEDGEYSFWQDTNSPKIIETEEFGLQKLQYIHQNPIRKDYVSRPEHWKWSSANQESEIEVANV